MSDNNDVLQQEPINERQEESIETAEVSPEQRRQQYHQQEGREIDATPLPSDDGDESDDEDAREP